MKASRKYDYGIFVASNDDITIKREQSSTSMRDNVLFEGGLFLGSLGLNRAFLVTHEKVSLPSDFNGVSTLSYSEKSVDLMIESLINELNKTRYSYCLKPLASAALALGYFENYVYKIAHKLYEENPKYKINVCIPRQLKNIDNHIKVNLSNCPSKPKYPDRPTVYEYNDKSLECWDIPTTLQTLEKLINMMVPSYEIGVNLEKEEWIKHELRNFAGTLTVLIQECPICRENVKIVYLE